MARKKPLGLPPAAAKTGDVYRLKVALEYLKPQIWRRIEVPDCTLEMLHVVIQRLMPWDSSHLWCFQVGRTRYQDEEFLDFPEDRPASEATLGQLAAAGVKKFRYTYDFGDSWDHQVTIEKTVPREAKIKYPRCTAGARACPPDDCGGYPGYERLLAVLGHPKDPEHEDMLEWAGGPIDPEAFDPDAINKDLAKLKM
ncbi:MAG TPA: plasmid pRiA4b ORF-3 family protein [Fimbriiglobus sp.]|nr:plasmid pRiA4b ORF-3 family protein [Fimbriiglobus sp.]